MTTGAPKTIALTINGRSVQARAGQTILEAAEDAGIHIPTLCHHPRLAPIGACRVCLVEIAQQRNLQPACTFPAADGLVVQTESPKVQQARQMNLELLFSERSHYCMTCPMSGSAGTSDCELQRLGYECSMTHWIYPPNTAKRWPVDASHRYLVLDQSRCVLCRRCARACAELASNYTLGVHQRGARAMIGADDGVPLAESSCISCGVCVQVCPTGALTDRISAYRGHDAQSKRTQSTCVGCAVGCGIETLVRDNQLLRVEGDFATPNAGLLCNTGRFEALLPAGRRITTPRLGANGQQRDATWDEVLAVMVEKLRSIRPAGLASPRLPDEALSAFAFFFNEVLNSNEVGLLYGEAPPLDLGTPATLADVANADCIAIIGGDPLAQHKVIGYLIKRAYRGGAKILVIDDSATGLDRYAATQLHLEELGLHAESPFARLRHTYHLRISGLNQLKSALTPAQRPVVLYGCGLSTTVHAALRALPARVRFLPLVTGANTCGAARLGLSTRAVDGEALYALLADDLPADPLPHAAFRIVQAAYESPWTAAADVVLPARLWYEQGGHVTSLEGIRKPLAPATTAPGAAWSELQVLTHLAMRMGFELPIDTLAAPAAQGGLHG